MLRGGGREKAFFDVNTKSIRIIDKNVNFLTYRGIQTDTDGSYTKSNVSHYLLNMDRPSNMDHQSKVWSKGRIKVRKFYAKRQNGA